MADEKDSEREDERDEESPSAEGQDGSAESDDAEGDEAEGGGSRDESDDEDDEDEPAPAAARDGADDDLDRRAEREAEAERKQLEREAEAREDEDDSMAALLGPERWVQFAFIAIGVAVFFLADRLTSQIWGYWAEPDAAIVSAVAAATAILGTFMLYRHPAVNQLADEVVGELSKVTWPTRDEVWISTLVVVATSVIAAAYTGVFDAMWSALTAVVYG
jgi:preprotein translocase subunit SecE